MTDHEAEAFLKRLKRIWAPEGCWGSTAFSWCRDEYDGCEFSANIQHGLYFRCSDDDGPYAVGTRAERILVLLRVHEGTGRCTGQLRSFMGRDEVEIGWGSLSSWEITNCEQFAHEWLPFFRRGSWLSGCGIEPSAHEKAEWIQGFTHEELEAWNLKV